MDALELIDKLEETVSKGKKIPFSSNFIVNENEIQLNNLMQYIISCKVKNGLFFQELSL